MALTCPAPTPSSERFEFIDCSSVSINYALSGLANVGFTVISSDGKINGLYNSVVFGGVTFTGPITSIGIDPIVRTTAYQFRFTILAFGC